MRAPATGLTAAEVAERVARGPDQRHRRAHEPHARRDRPGQRLHPVQRDPRHDARGDPRGRSDPGRAVRHRPRRQRADRHRPGGAGQAHPRPARGAQRAARARRARRRGAGDRGRGGRARRPARAAHRRPGPVRRRRAHAPTGSRSTSRCSPARPTRSTRPPATRCCRAASWSPAPGASRPTRVGADAYAAQARRRGPPVPAHPLRADRRHQHRSCASSPGCSSPSSALLLWRQLQRPRARRARCAAPSPASSAWCPRASCC